MYIRDGRTDRGQLSLAIPQWVGRMSTGQRAVMLCGWEVKAGMATKIYALMCGMHAHYQTTHDLNQWLNYLTIGGVSLFSGETAT